MKLKKTIKTVSGHEFDVDLTPEMQFRAKVGGVWHEASSFNQLQAELNQKAATPENIEWRHKLMVSANYHGEMWLSVFRKELGWSVEKGAYTCFRDGQTIGRFDPRDHTIVDDDPVLYDTQNIVTLRRRLSINLIERLVRGVRSGREEPGLLMSCLAKGTNELCDAYEEIIRHITRTLQNADMFTADSLLTLSDQYVRAGINPPKLDLLADEEDASPSLLNGAKHGADD